MRSESAPEDPPGVFHHRSCRVARIRGDLADGVVMTVTAQDPETVKKIQAHLTEFAGSGPHKGCKKECPRRKKAAA